MKFLMVATFKSNKVAEEVQAWVKDITRVAGKSVCEIVVAPSFPYVNLVKGKGLTRAAQDVSPFPSGSYTGAVNATQLKDLEVKYCIVGHSERRKYFHETHDMIANKIRELCEVNITPILCMAEEDIFPQLAALEGDLKDKVIYCYEPPSNIGGSETAPGEEITRVINLIRESVGECRVMYGGSVNAANSDSLFALGINGVLVASASLDAQSFIELINSYPDAEKK